VNGVVFFAHLTLVYGEDWDAIYDGDHMVYQGDGDITEKVLNHLVGRKLAMWETRNLGNYGLAALEWNQEFPEQLSAIPDRWFTDDHYNPYPDEVDDDEE
jgi:hypothetical protein